MDWNKLKAFYEVALNKSISKASNKLNLSPYRRAFQQLIKL